MKVGVFIHTVRNDYTNGRIAGDDTKAAMSVALMKVNDGLEYEYWSPEDSASWANGVFRTQGIDWMPWGVARGWSMAVAYNEGQLAGRHAAASGSEYILDLEPQGPDNPYWQCIPGTAHSFCAGYESTSNGLKLRPCTDARVTAGNLLLNEWKAEPIVGIWHPQAYWTAFELPMASGIMTAINPLLVAGIPRQLIYPVLPTFRSNKDDSSISADELEQSIDWVAEQGYPGLALWRRGLISGLQNERLLSMPDPFAKPVPLPPPPEPSAKQKALAAIESARVAVEAI